MGWGEVKTSGQFKSTKSGSSIMAYRYTREVRIVMLRSQSAHVKDKHMRVVPLILFAPYPFTPLPTMNSWPLLMIAILENN